MTPGQYSEDQLVEQPAIELFEELGWEHINAYNEMLGPNGLLGRDNRSEVFLTGRLRGAIVRLNPRVPVEASRSVSELLALVVQRGAVGVAPLSVRRAQGR